jgi:hypothetical protein
MTKRLLVFLLATGLLVVGCQSASNQATRDAGSDAGSDGGPDPPSDEFAKICWVSPIEEGLTAHSAANPGGVADISAMVVGRVFWGPLSVGYPSEPGYTIASSSLNDGFLVTYDDAGAVLEVEVVYWKTKWAAFTAGGALVREDHECTPVDDFDCEDADYLAVDVVKYDFDLTEQWRVSAGDDLMWFYEIGHGNHDAPIAVTAVADDGFAVSGAFMGEVVLGEGQPGETTLVAGSPEAIGAYVARFDGAGTLLESHALDDPLLPLAMVVHDGGEITVVGHSDQLDQPIGLEVIRVSQAGEAIWQREVAADLAADTNWRKPDIIAALDAGGGSLVITGNFRGNLVFDDGIQDPVEIASAGYPEAGDDARDLFFLAKIDGQGSWAWVRAPQAASMATWTWAGGFAIDPSGRVSLAGRMFGSGPLVLGADEPNETALVAEQYLAIYDAEGLLELAKPIGPIDGWVIPRSLTLLDDGSWIMTGRSWPDMGVEVTLHDGEKVSFDVSDEDVLSLVMNLCAL